LKKAIPEMLRWLVTPTRLEEGGEQQPLRSVTKKERKEGVKLVYHAAPSV